MALQQEHEPTFFERAEGFVKKYRNALLGVMAVLVIGAAYLFYKDYQSQKLGEEAGPEMSQAQIWYSSGEDSLALFGDGLSKGFLEIIDNYHGTRPANLSNYYAGTLYLKLSDYDNAIKHLSAFDGGASRTVGANAELLLGHAYAQSGDTENAANAYKSAANGVDNNTLTPFYLKTAGDYHSTLSKFKEAEGFYLRIKQEYPNSEEAQDIDRFIVSVQQKQR